MLTVVKIAAIVLIAFEWAFWLLGLDGPMMTSMSGAFLCGGFMVGWGMREMRGGGNRGKED